MGIELLGEDQLALATGRVALAVPLGERGRLSVAAGAGTQERAAPLGTARFVHLHGELAGGYALLPTGALTAWAVLDAEDMLALPSSELGPAEDVRHAPVVTGRAVLRRGPTSDPDLQRLPFDPVPTELD